VEFFTQLNGKCNLNMKEKAMLVFACITLLYVEKLKRIEGFYRKLHTVIETCVQETYFYLV
jgi:hypothetical protein